MTEPDLTVLQILTAWLREHGYDGLYDPDQECGCAIDDLVCCCEACDQCLPGYKVPDPDDLYDCLIGPKKEVEP